MKKNNELWKHISDFLDEQAFENLNNTFGRAEIKEIDKGDIIVIEQVGSEVILFNEESFKRKEGSNINFIKLINHKEEIIELIYDNLEKKRIGVQEFKQLDKFELQQSLLQYLSIKTIRPCCSEYPGSWPFCRSNC
jgi:hypothetical protein